MRIEECIKQSKTDVEAVLLYAAELRKGKSVEQLSQRDAMRKAWRVFKSVKGE